MAYFDNVKVGDKVYGLVFGKGKVKSVWGEDSFYSFEVEYKNGRYVVPYTIEGFPGWNTSNFDFQTVFYRNDIDKENFDFSYNDKELSIKDIIKLKIKNKLEIKCPSGIWQSSTKCPSDIMEKYLEDKKFNMFRKKTNE